MTRATPVKDSRTISTYTGACEMRRTTALSRSPIIGCVAIMIIDEHGRPIRLRRMIGHTVVGEMGFYRDVPRTASVVAEGPTVIYRLTRQAFDKMQAEDPFAAAALHKLIIRLLSDRLEFANREISALL